MKSKICFFILIFLNYSILTHANIIVIGGLTHEETTAPGYKYSGIISLQNSDKKDIEVKLYQRDYFFISTGEVYYNDPGTQERSNADWISFSPKRLIIPGNDIASINYSVNVPDQQLKGTFWSIIMVELVPEDSAESFRGESQDIGMGIKQSIRYGIQMVTHVSLDIQKKIKFINTQLIKEGDRIFLQLDVENICEVWLRASLWVEIFDNQGETKGKFEGGKLRIYPGTSVRYKPELTGLPDGRYKALVIIDSGDDNVFGANFNLEIK